MLPLSLSSKWPNGGHPEMALANITAPYTLPQDVRVSLHVNVKKFGAALDACLVTNSPCRPRPNEMLNDLFNPSDRMICLG